jgi:hypothetical protein
MACDAAAISLGVDNPGLWSPFIRCFLESIPMSMYPGLRTIHLLCGTFSAPMLLMYAVSSVQMAHSSWFKAKPAVTEAKLQMPAGYPDGRRLAIDVMTAHSIRGEINAVQQTPAGFTLRIVVPGTVHDVRYDRATGAVAVRTNIAGFMGMLNRLHHAAGFWHEYMPLKAWALLVGIVSFATVGLAATGLCMWWLRREERKLGVILLTANLAFSVIVLAMLRSAGP